MSNKKTLPLDQLKQMSLEDIKTYKKHAEERKAELVALKNSNTISEEQQEELDDVTIFLVDVDDIIEEKAKNSYNVPKGEEKLVHLSIVKGRRFNPNTGKEESSPVVQKFTYGEFIAFRNSHHLLGYVIVKVLHDPYNEAYKLIK